MNVPETVLHQTTECRNDFACLKNIQCKKPFMCEVDYAVGENVLFLVDEKTEYCPYRLSFAGRQVCTCPTYFAIYKNKQLRQFDF